MKFAVHYLEPEQECAVMVCMALLLSAKELEIVWPEAVTKAPDPEDVEVVVVPLQRIGAPAGKAAPRSSSCTCAPSNKAMARSRRQRHWS